MKLHELKTINPYFNEVWNDRKLFDVRKNDRDFEVGDVLWLRECDIHVGIASYLKREIIAEVTYVLKDVEKFGVKNGYCVMSIKILKKRYVENEEE